MRYQRDQYSARVSLSAWLRSRLQFILLSLAIITLLPALSLAQSATLTDDARTSANKPNKNFGADDTVEVSGTIQRGLLKFKLTPNLPAGTGGSYVGKATLKLFVSAVGASGQIIVQRVTSSWDEQSVTDATFPALGVTESTTTVNTGGDGKWVTIDITQLVKDWLDGLLPNNGIALVSSGGADVTFDSKENTGTSHEPRLEIVLNHAATADQATTADTATTATTANTISGVLPTNKGGTGLSAPGATGNVLRSNGTNWLSAPLVASDFPGLANSFIQNQNSTAQTATFSITGNGTAGGTLSGNVVNAGTQYNLGGQRVLSVSETSPDFGSTSLGLFAGSSGSGFNAFFGRAAGSSNTSGGSNSFFGFGAGFGNTSGLLNSFFGASSGVGNTTGESNAFFGSLAGGRNTVGSGNTMIGAVAGFNPANVPPTTGSRNTFLGVSSGQTNIAGSDNTLVGANADIGVNNLNFATALGSNARVSTSDLIVLGKVAGTYNGVARPADTVQIPGDLNVAGALTLNIVNANTQYNLGGSRFLSSNLGLENISLGQNAGPVNTGSFNAFFGTSAGAVNTGSFNSFFGRRAGVANTTGAANAFFGDNAGGNNATGSRNSFFGSGTGFSNVSGTDNSFFGYHSGINNTAGFNAFFGSFAGNNNSTGLANAFFGYSAGGSNTTTSSNAFFGYSAGYNNTQDGNSFFGAYSGYSNTTGDSNAFFGASSGGSNTIGVSNTFVGSAAGQFNTTGSNNSFIGRDAGIANTTGNLNSFFGRSAGLSNTAGSANSFFGVNAGQSNTTASFNAFFGDNAGGSNVGGSRNAYFGSGAGFAATQANDNSFFGYHTGLSNTTGGTNSFFGANAGLSNTTQGSNTFIGMNAGRANGTGDSTGTASFNTLVGSNAGISNTTGGLNTFFGDEAGTVNTTGARNAFFGSESGLTNATGTSNTLIGNLADVGANNLTNATAIGANAQVTQSNSLILGSINGVNGATANTKVGIGTTAPTSPLTVAGLIETTTGGVKFPDGTIQTTAASGSGGVTSLNTLTGSVTLAPGSNVTITPSGNTLTIASTGGGGGSSLSVRTEDGATAVSNVTELRVSNGTLTNDGSGSVSITTGGGSGSSNAILNQMTLQTSANFNIDGTGKANIFNAATQYNIGGSKLISNPGQNNLFVGIGAEGVTPSLANDILENTFFGTNSGQNNLECCNAFFGNYSGQSNTNGVGNTFIGYQAGRSNVGGSSNTFVGINAGLSHQNGNGNTFVGNQAGNVETSGTNNTFIGQAANVAQGVNNLIFATAIGAGSVVDASNTVVIGKAAIGQFPADTVRIPGDLTVQGTFSNPSDIRLKTGINNLHYGLGEVMRLRPVTWTWKNKSDGRNQLGLIAQEVKPVLPELVIEGTDQNHTLGLNYLGLLPIVIKSIQEQQATITALRTEIAALQNERAPAKLTTASFAEIGASTTCSGNVTTDANGEATVTLREDFESHNSDFRYQLTVIGTFSQAIVSGEIKNNRFTIKTDKPRVKVSWQVTGFRRIQAF